MIEVGQLVEVGSLPEAFGVYEFNALGTVLEVFNKGDVAKVLIASTGATLLCTADELVIIDFSQ